MNILTFLLVSIVGILATGYCFKKDIDNPFGFWILPAIILAISSVFFILYGILGPLGATYYTVEDASYHKVGDHIVAESKTFPLQSTSDMKFIDKDLEVVQTIETSVFGLHVDTDYEIRIRD